MKKYITVSLILFLSMLSVPLLSLNLSEFTFKNVRQSLAGKAAVYEEVPEESVQEAVSEETEPKTVRVMASASGEIITTDELEYLIGCVACEMPPSYEKEALKAQAVAAYTNLVRLKSKPDPALNGADISDSPLTHQGYYSTEKQKEKWGEKYPQYREKLEEAVREVYGEIITFNGEPITAAYCAVSPGRTEDAGAVWTGDVEYLKSVSSPGDSLSPDFTSTVVISAEQFKTAVSADSGIALGEDVSQWIGDTVLSDNSTGVVKSVRIGNKTLSGNAARELLGLRSPSFSVSYGDSAFTFTTKGYGHGVGMSQYGANYMAQTGSDYKDILLHYYTGVKIEKAD